MLSTPKGNAMTRLHMIINTFYKQHLGTDFGILTEPYS